MAGREPEASREHVPRFDHVALRCRRRGEIDAHAMLGKWGGAQRRARATFPLSTAQTFVSTIFLTIPKRTIPEEEAMSRIVLGC
ncbi:MAG TPA: hypothetical protein VH397_03885, partial [Xanthobacteraceae bacterium]